MNPYPGLRPFQTSEANWFMGREIVQGSLTTRLRISPLTVMVARSGVGKSSFLTCRLIPHLLKDSPIRYINEWGAQPAQDLLAAAIESFRRSANGFREKPVLVLDQFEDVFKLPNPRESLWDAMA